MKKILIILLLASQICNAQSFSQRTLKPILIQLSDNVSSTSTTVTGVTDWAIPVTIGKVYRVVINATYQSGATTTGGKLGFYMTSGSGTITGEIKGHITQSAASSPLSITVRTCTTAGAAGSILTTTAVNPINSPHYIGADIMFTCTETGVLQIGWGSEVNASAAQLNTGSILIYQLLN